MRKNIYSVLWLLASIFVFTFSVCQVTGTPLHNALIAVGVIGSVISGFCSLVYWAGINN